MATRGARLNGAAFLAAALALLGALGLTAPARAAVGGAQAASPIARLAPPRGAARRPITLEHSGAHGAIYLDGSRTARLIKSDCSSACAGPLFYLGGPVLSKPNVYAIYWNPTGAETSFPAGYEATIDTFFKNVELATSPLENVFSIDLLYGDRSSAGEYAWRYGGAYLDTAGLPTRNTSECPIATATEEQEEAEGKFGAPPGGEPCVTDAQIRTQIKNVIEAEGLPTGLGALYFIITPETVNSCAGGTGKEAECTTNSYCAYHWDVRGKAESEDIVYANMPYADRQGCSTPDQPNHSPADDELDVISHEANEAITDPLIAQTKQEETETLTGWLAYSGNEVADLCTYPFFDNGVDFNESLDAYGALIGGEAAKYNSFGELTTVGDAYDQEINGGHYLLQREWSNAAGGCVARAPAPSASFATYSSPATTGQAVAFNGGSSSAGAGELTSYEWEFGDGSGATGATLAATSHTYATPGTYTVRLTVSNDSGASATSAQQVTIDAAAPPAVTTVSTTTTVTTPAPTTRRSAADIAKLLGLPPNAKRLSVFGQLFLGHAECPPACEVTLKLTAKVTRRVHGHRVTRWTPIGTAQIQGTPKGAVYVKAPGPGMRELLISLSSAGRALLRKHHRLPVRLFVRVEEGSGASWTIERHLTLTSGAKSARHRLHAARRRR
jgi:PKD domain